MAELFRYAAFISYSSKDAPFARRLHRALEGYGIPSSLGKFDLIGGGGKPNRIYPVFRDREELAAGHLGDVIEANLGASAALIVVCSPNAAASPWVQKEIEYFAGLGRADKIFAIVAENAPLVDEQGRDATVASFPLAFRGDALAGDKLEPLAADARKGKDGFRNAWLKIVAGLIGITPGQIIDRDKRRRRQQRTAILSASVLLAVILGSIAATFEARSARGELAARAIDITHQGQPLDAMALALAGLPGSEDLISATHPEAMSALEDTGNRVPIVADYGKYVSFRLSRDGKHLLLVAGREADSALYDLRQPSAQPRLVGEVWRHAFSSDSRFLFTLDFNDNGALRYANDASEPVFIKHLVSAFRFSGDGRYLLIVSLARAGALYDLRDLSLPARDAGRVDSDGFALSSDGHFLVTHDVIRDLRGPVPINHPLGQVGGATISDERHLVLVQSAAGDLVSRDLGNLNAPAKPVATGIVDVSPDGRFALTRNATGAASLLDLRETEPAPHLLGDLVDSTFSDDGRFLISEDRAGFAALRDLRHPSAASYMLGDVDSNHFVFSREGRFLLTQAGDGVVILRDLQTQGRPRALGQLSSFGFNISGDDRFLVTRDPSGAVALRDLTYASRDNALNLRSQTCKVSRNVLRPVPHAIRSNPSDSLYRRLQGRPWNPCDWRGFLAIFPDHATGDGWLEGLRQWLRLIGVRYFHQPDYACDEINAAGSRSPARRRMCQLAERAASNPN